MGCPAAHSILCATQTVHYHLSIELQHFLQQVGGITAHTFMWCSEMLIQWVTKDSTAPKVRWGPTPGDYVASAAGTSITYSREDLCGGPAAAEGWMEPGLLHRATMTNLEPGRRYYYIYGDQASVSCHERVHGGLTVLRNSTDTEVLEAVPRGNTADIARHSCQTLMSDTHARWAVHNAGVALPREAHLQCTAPSSLPGA